MTITIRPIVFTGNLTGWRRLIQALEGRLLVEHPGWLVYAVGSGRVALHDAAGSDDPPGTVRLGFETDDLQQWSRATSAEHTLEETDHGLAATARAADGQWFWVDSPTPGTVEAAATPRLSALPIWVTADTAGACEVLTQVGARARTAGNDATWTDFSCDGGGLVAVHRGDGLGTVMAFEYTGDVEALAPRLEAAGVDVVLIDESYSRTLQVADPDGGPRLWINEQQSDLYGYRRIG